MNEKKIILVGSSSVGKSSIINRFINNDFGENAISPTVNNGLYDKEIINVNGEKVLLHIWDTAGQEKYKSSTKLFCRNSDVAFICFDLSNEDSITSIDYWISTVNDACENCVIYLVATKCDLYQNSNEFENVFKKYSENNYQCFKTSALDGTNINEIFKSAADEEKTKDIDDTEILTIKGDQKEKKCC